MKTSTLLRSASLAVALLGLPVVQGCYVRASGPAVRSPAVVVRPAPRPRARTVVVAPVRPRTVVVAPARPATVVIRPR